MEKLIAVALFVLVLASPLMAQSKADPNNGWVVPSFSSLNIRINPNSAWDYESKTNISGRITEFVSSGPFIVRCSRACEVFFTPERYTLVDRDSHSVLVKFNDGPVKRYGVSRSDDGTAYFFSDPLAILRAIRDNGGYITIEYTPSERIAQTVKYGVWNLPPSILKRLERTTQQHASGR